MRTSGIWILASILTLLITSYESLATKSHAEESLTITTYYPSPYGSYREMRAQRMAVGDNYIQGDQYCWPGDTCTTTINTNADLVVEGNVGIGLTDPAEKLSVNGNIVASGTICTAAGVCLGGAKAYATTGIFAGELTLCNSGVVPNLSLILNLTRSANVLINGLVQSNNAFYFYINVDGNSVGPYNQDSGTVTLTKIWPNLAAGNHTISINYAQIDNDCSGSGYNNSRNVVIRFLEAIEL